MAEELVLLTRLFDLLAWLMPRIEAIPRPYRHTVSQRLADPALDCQEAALARADAALSGLRLYLRLAHRWHWLSDGQYEHVSTLVAEVGRLLGGWLRQATA